MKKTDEYKKEMKKTLKKMRYFQSLLNKAKTEKAIIKNYKKICSLKKYFETMKNGYLNKILG